MLQDRVFPTCEQGGRGGVEMKRRGGVGERWR